MSSLLFAFSDDDCDGNGNDEVTSNVDPTSNPSNCPVTNDGRESLACFAICRITEPSICTEWRGGVSGTSAFSFSAAGFDASAANEDISILADEQRLVSETRRKVVRSLWKLHPAMVVVRKCEGKKP